MRQTKTMTLIIKISGIMRKRNLRQQLSLLFIEDSAGFGISFRKKLLDMVDISYTAVPFIPD